MYVGGEPCKDEQSTRASTDMRGLCTTCPGGRVVW